MGEGAAAALPLIIVPDAANAALLANRVLCAVSGYRREDLAGLRLADVLEWPADGAESRDVSPSQLRCRDGSTVEVEVRSSEIVAAGRRVGTLYELRPAGSGERRGRGRRRGHEPGDRGRGPRPQQSADGAERARRAALW